MTRSLTSPYKIATASAARLHIAHSNGRRFRLRNTARSSQVPLT